jgi:cytochrome d ubiquinol oxidase subunit I
MATSLVFHNLSAVVGIALPLLRVLAEALEERTGNPVCRSRARRWSRGPALVFAPAA